MSAKRKKATLADKVLGRAFQIKGLWHSPLGSAKATGRNEPCPCGKKDDDGRRKKYKKCCGKNQQI